MSKIHPTAVIDEEAQLADDVIVGAYTLIGPHVKIGAGSKIGTHCHIQGHTQIGINNIIYHGTAIGLAAQDFTFKNRDGQIKIGDNNVFRENCTVHLPVQPENVTTVGSDGYFMINAHIAHDCIVGDKVILVNNSAMGGYVKIGNGAYISHAVGIVQHCRIGENAIIGAVSKVAQDVPPCVLATGTTATAHGLNVIGMKRAGFTVEERKVLKEAFHILFLDRLSTTNAVIKIKNEILNGLTENSPEKNRLQKFVDFIEDAKKGIIGYSAEHAG